jgi:hypothetical protein
MTSLMDFVSQHKIDKSFISCFQMAQTLVRILPDGQQVKREVDFVLDQISETMTPMHYHAREVIFVTYNKVNYLSNMNLW